MGARAYSDCAEMVLMPNEKEYEIEGKKKCQHTK